MAALFSETLVSEGKKKSELARLPSSRQQFNWLGRTGKTRGEGDRPVDVEVVGFGDKPGKKAWRLRS